jgi:hypothetical protein
MPEAPVADPLTIEEAGQAVVARVSIKLFDDKTMKR